MHCFQIGGDDRRFNRALARRLAARCDVPLRVINHPVSAADIINGMQAAALVVAMRYHSVLFAHTLGVPFMAIDYTVGGKIEGFLADVGEASRVLSTGELSREGWESAVDRLLP